MGGLLKGDLWCRWDYIFDQLNENNVKSIKAKEAADLIKKGYVSPITSSLPHLSQCASHSYMLGQTEGQTEGCSLQMHLALRPCVFDLLACRPGRNTCAALTQVLVDVRPPHIFEKAHPEGSVNVPLFQRVNFRNFSVTGYLRAAALALNGVDPVEPNPKFGAIITSVSVLTPFGIILLQSVLLHSHCSDVSPV